MNKRKLCRKGRKQKKNSQGGGKRTLSVGVGKIPETGKKGAGWIEKVKEGRSGGNLNVPLRYSP